MPLLMLGPGVVEIDLLNYGNRQPEIRIIVTLFEIVAFINRKFSDCEEQLPSADCELTVGQLPVDYQTTGFFREYCLIITFNHQGPGGNYIKL